MPNLEPRLPSILERHEADLLTEWMTLLRNSAANRPGSTADQQLEESARTFLNALRRGLATGNLTDFSRGEWSGALQFLTSLSRRRAEEGYTPVETAMFVFSLKQPLFARIRKELDNDAQGLADESGAQLC